MSEPEASPASATPDAPSTPGWYPDPWTGDQHRWWDGHRWSQQAFPDSAAPLGGLREATSRSATTVTAPSPAWVAPVRPPVAQDPSGEAGATAPAPPESAERPGRRAHLAEPAVLALVLVPLGLLVGFLAVLGLHLLPRPGVRGRAASPVLAPRRPTLRPPLAAPPADPILQRLVLGSRDVGTGISVDVIPGGTSTTDQPTLDLCNGTFPSEAHRAARLQVAASDASATTLLSTEGVLYDTAASGSQAEAEVVAAARSCPPGPVESPVGEPRVSTTFAPPPDASWPQVATVERAAFEFTSSDDEGRPHHAVAAYLRRGRVLLAVYFSSPEGPQPAVEGHADVAGIVDVFARRLAGLTAEAANGVA